MHYAPLMEIFTLQRVLAAVVWIALASWSFYVGRRSSRVQRRVSMFALSGLAALWAGFAFFLKPIVFDGAVSLSVWIVTFLQAVTVFTITLVVYLSKDLDESEQRSKNAEY